MTRLRPRFPLTVATLWVALLLTALPAGETELSGESENYAASARLEDGMFHVTIVNKVSGKKVSYRDSTRATSLTEISVPETEEWVIVHGKVGSRGDIRFEFNVNYLGYTDRIYQLIRESEHYSVSVQLTELEEWAEWNRVLDITVVNKHSGKKASRRSPTRTAKLTELYILEAEQRLIVHGELGSRGDILSVVNLEDASVVDTIYGWDASFSPTKTRVAYNFRYPPHSMHQHRTSVLLIYDFSATPRENSFRDTDMADPTTRGYVIYPERNRKLGKHFIPAMSEEGQIYFESPIAWSHGGTKVALLEAVQGDTYLLVADFAKGLEAPEVTRSLLDKERYCKPPIESQERKKYETVPISAENVFRFGMDDKSVLFTTDGCWSGEEHEVVMELD